MWPFKTNSWTNPLPFYAQDPEKRVFLETVLRKISTIPNADWKGKNSGEPHEFYKESYDSDSGRQERRREYEFYETTTQGGVTVKLCHENASTHIKDKYFLLMDEQKMIDYKGGSSWDSASGHEGLVALWDRIHKEREPLRKQKYKEKQLEEEKQQKLRKMQEAQKKGNFLDRL